MQTNKKNGGAGPDTKTNPPFKSMGGARNMPYGRQRANSSLTDMAVIDSHHFQPGTAMAAMGASRGPSSSKYDLEATVTNLIDDKYNREYKLDKKTREKAFEILNEYYSKSLSQADLTEDLMVHTTVRAAILIASKCQVYQTDDGSYVRGCGLSTSMFLRGRPQIQIEEFQRKLEEVRLEANLEQVVIQECVKVQNKLGLNLNFYEKFSKLWESLGIKDRSLSVSAVQSMKKLTWLMFILGKVKILQGSEDITEMAFLLFACLYWALMLSPQDVQSDLLERFKEDVAGQQSSCDERLAALDKQVRDFLSKELKSQQSSEHTDVMVGYLRDMLLKMKWKTRLQGFSSLDEEEDEAEKNAEEVAPHMPMTYKGICDQKESIQGDNFCHLRPSKCLHGIFDQGNITRNIRLLDQYYAQQMNCEYDFDERFFINHNGLQHTPIKLVSPINTFGNTPVALQQNSSTAGLKSPMPKGNSALAALAEQNHQVNKRARGDSIQLTFVTLDEVQNQPAGIDDSQKKPTDDSQSQSITTANNQVMFEGRPNMQRRLEFNQSLNEMTLREQLNMQQFPQFDQTPGHQAASHPSQQRSGGPLTDHQAYPSSLNLQTPIGQMMALRQWVDDLQRQVTLDPASSFLVDLRSFVRVPAELKTEEDQKRYVNEYGAAIRTRIQSKMLKKLLQKLNQKRVQERSPQEQVFFEEFEQKHAESIFMISCCLMEKALVKEMRRQRALNKELPELFKFEIFEKSFLIYACLIYFYSKNISDLTVKDMLDELQLPAYDLWVTFNTLITLDPNMPRQLREHFLDIERQLTLHLIWQKDTYIVSRLQQIIRRNEEEEALALQQSQQQQANNDQIGSEEGKTMPVETFADMHARNVGEEKALNSFRLFFNRVKQIAANSIQEMCEHLKISEECRELIWNVLLVTLGLKSGLLFGRHLDQLIMCAIYGVCKIHAGNTSVQVLRRPPMQGDQPFTGIKFMDIIDAYKEVHKSHLQKSGRWQVNISQSNSVSWVFVEVPLNPEADNPIKVDIIKFYNDVFLEKMKAHILKTKTLTLEQGSKTPVLSQSNFDALLTPGGRVFKPVINHFTKLTPLIDSLGKNKRFSTVTYTSQPGVGMVSTAGVLATPAIGQSGIRSNLPFLTPRTNALYASNERPFSGRTTHAQFDSKNPAEMAKQYANMPVHRIASSASFGEGSAVDSNASANNNKITNPQQIVNQQHKLSIFAKLASQSNHDKAGGNKRPPQPIFTKGATNLGQIKAPPTIAERPSTEECDQHHLQPDQGRNAIQKLASHQTQLENSSNAQQVRSPNSIVAGNFFNNDKPVNLIQASEEASGPTQPTLKQQPTIDLDRTTPRKDEDQGEECQQ